MDRKTFFKMLGGGSLSAFLSPSLWANRLPQDGGKECFATATKPTEPIDALDRILCQLAEEFNTRVESCTGEGHSHSSTIKSFKLPKKFNGKDWWLCLKTQTTHSHGYIEKHESEHFTRATLCVESHNPISEHTQHWLAKFIQGGGSGCGNGGFGVDVYARTCTLKGTGEIKLISTDIDMRRRLYYGDIIHPLHKRVISLFEQMTAG